MNHLPISVHLDLWNMFLDLYGYRMTYNDLWTTFDFQQIHILCNDKINTTVTNTNTNIKILVASYDLFTYINILF